MADYEHILHKYQTPLPVTMPVLSVKVSVSHSYVRQIPTKFPGLLAFGH